MPEASHHMMSPHLGEISWDPDCELRFPSGLPGFEQHTRMIPIEIPSQRPLIYLQSAAQREVCFVALPVLAVCPFFELRLSEDELWLLDPDQLGLPHNAPAALGTDVLCLALLVPFENTVQTNLDAPIVINLHNRRGIQAMASASGSYRLGEGGTWTAVC